MCDTVEWGGEAASPRLCYSVSASALSFQVRAQRQAELGLLTSADRSENYYKIKLDNVRESEIASDNRPIKKVSVPELLSEAEWRGFWVTWHRGHIRVGRAGDAGAFLSAAVPERPRFKFVMPAAGAQWRLDLGPVRPRSVARRVSGGAPTWVAATDGRPPPGALIGGHEDEPLTVIRAPHLGSVTPGKYAPSRGAFVGRDWLMHPKLEFEALVGYNVEWVATSGGNVPAGAVPAGYSEGRGNETLYVARAPHKRHLILGKVHPSHGTAYIPYHGKEIRKSQYEILVHHPDEDPRAVIYTSRQHGDESESEEEDEVVLMDD